MEVKNKWEQSKVVESLYFYGDFSTKKRWAMLQRFSSKYFELSLWFPDCGFSPREKYFTSLEAAKKYGEKWVNYDCD